MWQTAFEPDANVKLFQKMMEDDCSWEWVFQVDPSLVETDVGRGTCSCACITWNTLGALTREARAEDSVAEKMPAVMRGPNPDTMLMTLRKDIPVRRLIHHTIKKESQNFMQMLPFLLSVIWNLLYKLIASNQIAPRPCFILEFLNICFFQNGHGHFVVIVYNNKKCSPQYIQKILERINKEMISRTLTTLPLSFWAYVSWTMGNPIQ